MKCHYCHQPLAKHEAHDRRMPLPASVARTLPRWRRGQ